MFYSKGDAAADDNNDGKDGDDHENVECHGDDDEDNDDESDDESDDEDYNDEFDD